MVENYKPEEDVQIKEEDPMLNKKFDFYNQVFAKEETNNENPNNKVKKEKSKQAQATKSNQSSSQPAKKTPEQIEKERIKQLRLRNKQKKLHMERTKKGQPVMKNLINSLLQKVQKVVGTK